MIPRFPEPALDDDGTTRVWFIYESDHGPTTLVRRVDVDAFDNILAELNPMEAS